MSTLVDYLLTLGESIGSNVGRELESAQVSNAMSMASLEEIDTSLTCLNFQQHGLSILYLL